MASLVTTEQVPVKLKSLPTTNRYQQTDKSSAASNNSPV